MPTLLQEQKCIWKLDEDMDPAAVRGISNQSVTADLLWPQTSGFVAARASYFHFIDQLITRASYQTIDICQGWNWRKKQGDDDDVMMMQAIMMTYLQEATPGRSDYSFQYSILDDDTGITHSRC